MAQVTVLTISQWGTLKLFKFSKMQFCAGWWNYPSSLLRKSVSRLISKYLLWNNLPLFKHLVFFWMKCVCDCCNVFFLFLNLTASQLCGIGLISSWEPRKKESSHWTLELKETTQTHEYQWKAQDVLYLVPKINVHYRGHKWLGWFFGGYGRWHEWRSDFSATIFLFF